MKKTAPFKRVKIRLQGAVQGVGFRPFVWRLANELHINGSVGNGVRGVEIDAEGDEFVLRAFIERLIQDAPVNAHIDAQDYDYQTSLVGYRHFEIRESDDRGEKTALVLPDMATCPECISEVFDPSDRRYRYPFTNCTNCGPRYTIIERVPYDRPNTTMRSFPMCPLCEAEYRNPADRRFYAQPNACPKCGPHLELWEKDGKISAIRDEALFAAENIIRNGGIVAMKGLGGFQLLVDARNEEAVTQLRIKKGRPGAKPFALMYPSLEMVKSDCEVSSEEEKLLLSREAPIVLLERKALPSHLSDEVAPGIHVLGVMLPYTPLHHLLMSDLGFPIVATSGNLSDEPIVTDENEAVDTLRHIADAFLIHNRGIVRHVDDSIVRVIAGKQVVTRRARGYAPLPVDLKQSSNDHPCIVAFGPHLKNTGAVCVGEKVFFTQHIGDTETVKAVNALEHSVRDILSFREQKPDIITCDMHPDYASTRLARLFAQEHGVPLIEVQHHEAHVLSCMAENEILDAPALGISFDGTGFGRDTLSWGGEFFLVRKGIKRIGHLRSFVLLGGDAAAREPKRVASAMLAELFGSKVFENESFAPICALTASERMLFPKVFENAALAHRSTSIGRFFDGVSSLLDICHSSDYEGHAAILLEQAIKGNETKEAYRFRFSEDDVPFVLDWHDIVLHVLDDLAAGVPKGKIAAKFHNTIAEAVVYVARELHEERVVLSGGCFQNKYLLEESIMRLQQVAHVPFFHVRTPSNDGGIALGQIASVILQINQKRPISCV